jgi:hypothetical protein
VRTRGGAFSHQDGTYIMQEKKKTEQSPEKKPEQSRAQSHNSSPDILELKAQLEAARIAIEELRQARQKRGSESNGLKHSAPGDFVFVPDFTEDSIPYVQHHFGLDFSGGRVVSVTDPVIARKLDGNRFFGRVDKTGALIPGQHVNNPKAKQESPKWKLPTGRSKDEESDPDKLPSMFD